MKLRRQWLAAGLTFMPVTLVGQGVAVGAARWLTSPHVSEYRVGMDGFSYGAVSFRPTIQYLTQGAIRSPTFIVWANHPRGVSPSYRRFLINQLRKRYGFRGTPLRIAVKARKDRHDQG